MIEEKQEPQKRPTKAQSLFALWSPYVLAALALIVWFALGATAAYTAMFASSAVNLVSVGCGWKPKTFLSWEVELVVGSATFMMVLQAVGLS